MREEVMGAKSQVENGVKEVVWGDDGEVMTREKTRPPTLLENLPKDADLLMSK